MAQDRSPRKPITTLDGKEIFNSYCAKGHGPVARAIRTGLPDLTTLARQKSKFPTEGLEKFILGDGNPAAAHGSREMPVWGPLFRHVENDQDLGLIRARRVVEYIQSLQRR
jgi:hypothetical protein